MYEFQDFFRYALIAGGLGGGLFIVSLIINVLWSWAWAWVDDWVDDWEKDVKGSVVFSFFTKIIWGMCHYSLLPKNHEAYGNKYYIYWGLNKKEADSSYVEQKYDRTDDPVPFFFGILIVTIVFPFIAVLAAFFYEISIAIVTMFVIARVARVARRGQKALTKHMVDVNAHKEEKGS